jgi:hypothetical protein
VKAAKRRGFFAKKLTGERKSAILLPGTDKGGIDLAEQKFFQLQNTSKPGKSQDFPLISGRLLPEWP